ncbi:3-keto-disaccharide hydrolase [Dyadobacter sp.]|uniref:3-keto-disaccharide hydrolase n=1 Tax=Dyadobacter sp. TaxID=1914288 RepID=UPI003F729EF0
MKKGTQLLALALLLSLVTTLAAHAQDGWISLFNGKDLTGWKVGANAGSFTIVDGTIQVAGPRAHLFYEGPVKNHMFKNFEFKATVKTKPGSNSGIFIHTAYQEDGWPSQGYEVQVNQSHTDWKRTGSLYNVVDVKETYVKDDEWYTEYIKVEGKHITIKINDKVVVDYEETDVDKRQGDMKNKFLKSGTFALQAHDPKSVVFYKDIMVKPLTE